MAFSAVPIEQRFQLAVHPSTVPGAGASSVAVYTEVCEVSIRRLCRWPERIPVERKVWACLPLSQNSYSELPERLTVPLEIKSATRWSSFPLHSLRLLELSLSHALSNPAELTSSEQRPVPLSAPQVYSGIRFRERARPSPAPVRPQCGTSYANTAPMPVPERPLTAIELCWVVLKALRP